MEMGGFLPHRTRTLEECQIHQISMLPSRVSFLAHKQTLKKVTKRMGKLYETHTYKANKSKVHQNRCAYKHSTKTKNHKHAQHL
ncbi:hypothetical protein XELAEV_18004337mg [Xenopus laevis]|uniref:Uncharacterized protein n=1 Tax=Xenopus laevis TaxID=8355 RepID=A0A974BP73_XENLA|nr:hypothetical protein XELAEV_18004337mg [Xenopus laevis]